MDTSKKRPLVVIHDWDGDIRSQVWIVCARTGKRMRWNDAARAGWTTGVRPFTYESPEEHATES